MNYHITKERLVTAEACARQTKLFEKKFPDGVTLSRETLLKYGSYFDIDFFVMCMLDLDERQQTEYCLRARADTVIRPNMTPSEIKEAVLRGQQLPRRWLTFFAPLMSLSFWNDPFGVRRLRQFSRLLDEARGTVFKLKVDLDRANLRAERLKEAATEQWDELRLCRNKHRQVVVLLTDYFQLMSSQCAKDKTMAELYKWL